MFDDIEIPGDIEIPPSGIQPRSVPADYKPNRGARLALTRSEGYEENYQAAIAHRQAIIDALPRPLSVADLEFLNSLPVSIRATLKFP